ncbi:MAG: formylglycine-generating enzyme family protein [Lentisphaerae bacterium]|jgi:formylglycine-generating enzyme required for sulfatase activity|nr:formylglycine-generating enzyme family protein [Lentisphaerota bacterium]
MQSEKQNDELGGPTPFPTPFLKKFRIGMVVFAAMAGMAAAQTNTAAFFRISSPSNALITEFDVATGTISWSNGVAGVTNQLQRSVDLTKTNGWVDYAMLVSTGATVCTEQIIDLNPPEGMAWIPGGNFSMGDSKAEGWDAELPVHSVYVDGFYMDRTEVTKAKWDVVYNWARSHGYSFIHAGSGKASNHPVHTVNWYDCVKWCNARSEMEGRTPCYTVSGSTYKTGQSEPDCNFKANGYRLPTEAEWEKAARGGLQGKRFPWGDTISHDNANYCANGSAYSYDTSPYTKYTFHPSYDDGGTSYTSPVGSFSANGYGLYDMAGNVWEWCWDWYGSGYYASSPSSNPQGPSSGSYRMSRGGGWGDLANYCRSASRLDCFPDGVDDCTGFRVVRR